MSSDSSKMTCWDGASPGSDKCACGMNNSRAAKKNAVTVMRMTKYGAKTAVS